MRLASLALGTAIPTPTGWTTMGELAAGDQVFDDQGSPCTVTYATPVQVEVTWTACAAAVRNRPAS